MSRLPLSGLVLCALALVVPTPGGSDVDRRSHEQVRIDCASGELRREVTLFANGTVRLRDSGGDEPGLKLAELQPAELEAFQNRMTEIDMSEVESRVRGPNSESLEQCLVRLELKSGELAEYRFVRMAALPLALSRLLGVIDDLVELAEERVRQTSGLPMDYRPRAGDVLVKRDGSRHRVVRITADGGGVEIVGLESPLVVYLSIEAMRGEFAELESRRRALTRRPR